MKKTDHHSLLFSKYFKYFWKFIFKKNSYFSNFYVSSNISVYGSEKKGFYVNANNGIKMKFFFPLDKKENEVIIFVYFNDVFFMKYGLKYCRNQNIIKNNPLITCPPYKVEQAVLDIKRFLKSADDVFIENSKNLHTLNFSSICKNRFDLGYTISSRQVGKNTGVIGCYTYSSNNYDIKDGIFTLVGIYLQQTHNISDEKLLKISKSLSYSRYVSFKRLFKNDTAVGFIMSVDTYESDSVFAFVFDTYNFSIIEYQSGYYVKSKSYILKGPESIFKILNECVTTLIKRYPSETFYSTAASLGMDINKKDKITDDIFEMFEMLDY